jgi:hypothetical protein
MESIAGLLVCVGLWVLGWLLGAPVMVGLVGALAFGSTAIGPAPVYAPAAVVLLVVTLAHRGFWGDLGSVLKDQVLVYLIWAIIAYAVVTAFVLPRLFVEQTMVFVPVNNQIVPLPLRPVPGNLNRSAYLILNGLIFLAVCIQLRRGAMAEIRLGFLVFAGANAALGLTDVIGKLVGMGDLLAPIRTADYNMLTEQTAGQFFRIMGAFPEPSGYAGGGALPALAFAFVDWRSTGSRISLTIAVVLLMLLIFSTSSTAYAGLAILLAVYSVASVVSILRGRIQMHHILMFASGWIALTMLVALYLYDERQMDPIVKMLLDATLNKSESASALERGMWNAQSIQNFFDTFGMGVGLGSTRSSSWPISVLAQLGAIGSVGFIIAVAALATGPLRLREPGVGPLAASASCAALAWMAGSSFGGNAADPNMLFFLAMATVSTCMAKTARTSSRVTAFSRQGPASLRTQ